MRFFILLVSLSFSVYASVDLGVDVFFQTAYCEMIKGKRVGLITNHTARDRNLITTIDRFKEQKQGRLVALFAPEHGIDGKVHAGDHVDRTVDKDQIPIYSLYGKTRRPTKDMLQNIDILVYDIQDIGSRPYTYSTTLFYVMEEASKSHIPVIVLDRPNPLGGRMVDGPMLEEKWRSFLGYINVPYCHGMTIGELALFFNQEYKVGCSLHVIPMKGWNRSMSFRDTGLSWMPSSPNIPEADTPFFYPTTGISGELQIFNIGIGYTLPFKIMGAPWIDAGAFSERLNHLHIEGVSFVPFHYRPYYGAYRNQDCHGVLIVMENMSVYRPLTVQFALLGMLKSLYPKEFLKKLSEVEPSHRKTFCQAIGSDLIFSILEKEKYPYLRLLRFHKKEREAFLLVRKKYLLPEYGS